MRIQRMFLVLTGILHAGAGGYAHRSFDWQQNPRVDQNAVSDVFFGLGLPSVILVSVLTLGVLVSIYCLGVFRLAAERPASADKAPAARRLTARRYQLPLSGAGRGSLDPYGTEAGRPHLRAASTALPGEESRREKNQTTPRGH